MADGVVNPDELADLEEQRTFLLRSLDDLDRELAAGDLDTLDAATLRDDYTRRLAEVQDAIETGEVAIATAARPRSPRRTAVVTAIVAVLAVGAGVAVANTAGSRRPGDTLTGDIRETSVDRLGRAADLQDDGRFLDALKTYDALLKDDPDNAEALAERGFLLLRLTMGNPEASLVEDGRRYIERALAIEPGNPRWLFYRGVALRLGGDDAGATRAFDDALAHDPPPALRRTIEALRTSLGL